ncbi:hypothetical protein [Pseudomonas aeruginosa]|uniref:hypothetical protein n=1 Tax=Pseudomonas aeruginosa TaxID=287 RepID=UPI0013A54CD7|nr:hypothetical protein [Pseudomonas aeruginosa]MBI7310058.1 hypothetical protein [Pseudomonas aeruginosa]
MPVLMRNDAEDILSLNELINLLTDSVHIKSVKSGQYSQQDLSVLGGYLASFGRNLSGIASLVCQELERTEGFQTNNDMQPPTFIIHRGKDFALRMVLWLPDGPQVAARSFSYDELHDHNFDFFTCNVFGDGYKTITYRYDYHSISGYPGEELDLLYLGEEVLTAETIMFYQKSLDAHTQIPPENLTVSLNLIIPPPQPANRQYEFEIIGKRISRVQRARVIRKNLDRHRLQRRMLSALFYLNTHESKGLLKRISEQHAVEEVRGIAQDLLMFPVKDKVGQGD